MKLEFIKGYADAIDIDDADQYIVYDLQMGEVDLNKSEIRFELDLPGWINDPKDYDDVVTAFELKGWRLQK